MFFTGYDIGELLILRYSNYTCNQRTNSHNNCSLTTNMRIYSVESFTQREYIRNIYYICSPSNQHLASALNLDKILQVLMKIMNMPENTYDEPAIKVTIKSTKTTTSYRGFASIDQEIEREIAMQWFTTSNKNTYSQRSFLLKKERV